LASAYIRFQQWTPLQHYMFHHYLWANAMNGLDVQQSNYRFVFEFAPDKKLYWLNERDLEPGQVRMKDGKVLPFTLTEEAYRQGLRFDPLEPAKWNNRDVEQELRRQYHHGQTLGDMIAPSLWWGLTTLLVSLCTTIPISLRQARERREGRRLKGPELVTTAQFNRRMKSDGIGFPNRIRRTFVEWLLARLGHILRIPRNRENHHFLIMGDTGTGKGQLQGAILEQVEERGEGAIVYDPALEYASAFFDQSRGDIVLNPLDLRMPYWSPADEVQHDAEALTVATSLFPDTQLGNPFFVEGPRKIFAHLLTLKPTPEELVWWLCHEQELDRRLKGTELAALIHPGASAQRAGILASLNMVADSMKLLPKRGDTERRWSAAEWVKQRQGWIFLTSTPEVRQRLLPLTSLWLDLLVLRLMNQARPGVRPVWFILDELASLQKLPQLHTALTENRKSNNPVVIGFQGRSQLEKRYGLDAETMLAQPATKIFLRTDEARAANWISETIGEVELEFEQETVTEGERRSHSTHRYTQTKKLILASEISGLEDLHGYLKHGNLIVKLHMPHQTREPRAQGFIPRPASSPGTVETMPPKTNPPAGPAFQEMAPAEIVQPPEQQAPMLDAQ
jgi:hypothetical protein